MRQKPIVEIILGVANDVSKASINATANVVGFRCELFFSKGEIADDIPNVFDDDSQNHLYNQVRDKEKLLIVIGLFGDKFKASDKSFDQYGGEGSPYILTNKDEMIPVHTKVKIHRGAEYHIMKVQDHEVYPSVKGQIYFKNLLVPYN